MLKRNNLILVIVMAMALLWPSFVLAKGVRINELCLLPEKGKPAWIELYNTDAAFVNASGYKLTTKSGEITFPASVGAIAAKSYMIVIFDGKTHAVHNNDITVVHVNNEAFLKANPIEITLSQFVTRINEKSKKSTEVWDTIDHVTWDKQATPGQSMVLTALAAWVIYNREDVTPGFPNPVVYYPPRMLEPPDAAQLLDKCPNFSWVSTSPKTTVQFSATRDFSTILARVDATDKVLRRCPKALKPGVMYYWRLRARDDEGHVSAWSSSQSFSFKP